jgi:hypothetical protein
MSQQNRKRQHLEQQQQKEEENDNRSIDGVNRDDWSFNPQLLENNTNSSDGNELREMKQKMAALEA